MLPIERKNKIKELILERHAMKISELSDEIGVSEMTIHRDIKPLIEEGVVVKTFGGITSANKKEEYTKEDVCDFCHRKVEDRLAYRLFLPEDIMVTACCAHCGLLKYRQLKDKVSHAICRDLIMQTTISAPLAWYVMETSIQVGCCEPQVLTFKHEEHARNFIQGFGGKLYRFDEALEMVHQKMSSDNHSCGH
ncbi:DeoR family transcriptional regulator [Oceanobacillus sp. FSL H7-0719]|uniref:DeoR family transcriptional regulator n=1 Tax=Oceanobacillus sp. FSL H7-0719 TaxID=2954507 RepID=UPI0032504A89